ncbi:MAG: dephospho-CoA kinase [Acidimicrobiales bacterium]|nr:dephospho-CoA kinase [Acidimicrobiales bacterium]
MVRIGLTGGIGSGKSTVSAALAERGAQVIDADAVVRELQQPGRPVLAAMVDRFGPAILHPDGSLDRQAVADIVFNDAAALKDLNAIVHPAVGAEILARLAAAEERGGIIVLDVPLLVENDAIEVDAIVVVDTDPEIAVERLIAHRGFDAADARARMARQATREERLARADHVVRNDGDLDHLDAEVERLWAWILDRQAATPEPG